MNRFAEALMSGRLVLTTECLPPRGSDPEAIRLFSAMMPQSVDAVVVADNPDVIRGSAFSAARILVSQGQTGVILSMATRDRNRLALLSDALGAAALNIDALLCMSGNHQSLGICSQAASANDLDSIQFTQAMKKLVLYGQGINGKEVEPGLEFQIGATAHPYLRPLELSLLRLTKKVQAGADFVFTQAIFDFEKFSEWIDGVRAAGFDKRTAIIASVLPLASVEKGRELQLAQTYGPIPESIIARISESAQPSQEGAAIAADMVMRLKEVPEIRGIHILNGGSDSLMVEVIQQAGMEVSTVGLKFRKRYANA
jgi:methylenetetrahydrofolate reductase (NADPH)